MAYNSLLEIHVSSLSFSYSLTSFSPHSSFFKYSSGFTKQGDLIYTHSNTASSSGLLPELKSIYLTAKWRHSLGILHLLKLSITPWKYIAFFPEVCLSCVALISSKSRIMHHVIFCINSADLRGLPSSVWYGMSQHWISVSLLN